MRANNYFRVVTFLCVFLGTYSYAFAAGDHMKGDKAHAEMMKNVTELMRDIGDHMVLISGDLSYGTLNLKQQRAMAEHIRNMAVMLVDLSNATDKGSVADTADKNMHKMRRQMDQMMKEVSIGTMKPW